MILELQREILSYIEPWLTRDDWRTCKVWEAEVIRETIQTLEHSRPRNNYIPIPYTTWSFYERLRFGKDHYLESPYFWRLRMKNRN
jgi:hypothetical protein